MELVQGEAAERLFLVRRTVLEMLRDRGYLVSEEENTMTHDGFFERFGMQFRRPDLDFKRSMRTNPADSICVFFPEEKLGRNKIGAYLQQMNYAEYAKAIFVVQDKPTSWLYQAIQGYTAKHLEIFMERELVVNISKHALVPRHQLLTSDEKQQLLARYNVKLTQLPRIQLTDPQAKYHGVRRGDVVKITRQSETAGRYITYRLVV